MTEDFITDKRVMSQGRFIRAPPPYILICLSVIYIEREWNTTQKTDSE